jgi:hypothetical protein
LLRTWYRTTKLDNWLMRKEALNRPSRGWSAASAGSALPHALCDSVRRCISLGNQSTLVFQNLTHDACCVSASQ